MSQIAALIQFCGYTFLVGLFFVLGLTVAIQISEYLENVLFRR